MKKNSKSCLLNALLVISTTVLVMSIAVLFHWYSEGKNVQKEIQNIKITQESDEDKPTDKKEVPKILNCVAWLEIPNTSIDFPVMQKKGVSEYYLRRNYKGEYSYSGTPFLDENCTIGISQNLIIYGHNMKDGKMFADLLKYRDKEYCASHNIINFITPNGVNKYEVVAVCKVKSDDKWYSYTCQTDKELFNNFISEIKNKSLYQTDKSVEYWDYFLTLSTCEYSQTNGRLIVITVRI